MEIRIGHLVTYWVDKTMCLVKSFLDKTINKIIIPNASKEDIKLSKPAPFIMDLSFMENEDSTITVAKAINSSQNPTQAAYEAVTDMLKDNPEFGTRRATDAYVREEGWHENFKAAVQIHFDILKDAGAEFDETVVMLGLLTDKIEVPSAKKIGVIA